MDKTSRTQPSRAAVLHPLVKSGGTDARLPEARLGEAIGLAEAIALDVALAEVVPVSRVRPATYLGGGAVDRLAPMLKDLEIGLVITDCHLSAIQQRNLEKAWDVKVIDRTGLILEIFGERARTREGQLQVELAHLTYQRSRLVRSWTHLERQRGGLGFIGGPGETQIEIDRRLIGERIARLKKDLEEVKRTRQLHRQARKRIPYPIVALVGYTNAGKSTLFNTITKAEVYAQDQLFATLDPTMRALAMPSGRTVILSDTVGFVSDLPHELVAAFHATLEEVLEADVIVHVRDISHPDSEAQKADVERVLRRELGLDKEVDEGLVEALNKIDLLDDETGHQIRAQARREDALVAISAVTGEGTRELLKAVDDRLNRARVTLEVAVPHSDGATLAWLYRRGEVLSRRDDETEAVVLVRLDPADAGRFQQKQGGQVY